MNATENTTDGTQSDQKWYQIPGWIWAFNNIIVWLMPILLGFGVIFNILCFLTIFRNTKTFPKISRRNMLIIAAWDVIVLSVGGTNVYHGYWNRSTKYNIVPSFLARHSDSQAACHILNFLYKYFLNGTPFFHVGLTIERVLAVVMPLKVKRIMTVRNHCIIIVALFIIGSIDSALWAAEQEYYDGKCIGSRNEALIKILDPLQYNIEFYVTKVTLFIVLLTGCIIVAVSLWLQSKRMAKLSNTTANLKQVKMVGACIVMIVMNIVFFLTHAPRAAISVYEGYCQKWNVCSLSEAELSLAYQISEGVMFLHNIADPFAYFIGKGFRMAFKQNLKYIANLLLCSTLRRQPSNDNEMTAAVTTRTGSGG